VALALALSAWAWSAALAERLPGGARSQALSLRPNQSFLIDCSHPVKRVAVGKPEIADVTVVTPRQLLVTGKSPGGTTLIYWNENDAPTTVDLNVWVGQDEIREGLAKAAPGERFELTTAGDSIILTGTVSTEQVRHRLAEAARAYAKQVIDLLRVERADQVLIQVRVAEVDRSVARELGFNMLFEHSAYRGAVSPGSAFTPFFGNLRDDQTANVGPNAAFSDAVNLFVAKPGAFPKFAGFLRALQERGAIRTLAEPNLVVADGGEGKFLAGGEFPVVYSTAAGGASSIAVTYKEFGVRLAFQPRIEPNGEIRLRLAQEVSDLDFGNAVVLSGFRIPALRSRKAESSLQLADGQTFALAGLIDNKTSKQVAKVPLLGDIPVLGALFRSTRFANNETELVILVTPRLVRRGVREELPPLPTDRMKPEEIGPGIFP